MHTCNTYTCMHTYTYTDTRAYTHTYTCMHTNTYMHTRHTCIQIHTCIHTCIHAYPGDSFTGGMTTHLRPKIECFPTLIFARSPRKTQSGSIIVCSGVYVVCMYVHVIVCPCQSEKISIIYVISRGHCFCWWADVACTKSTLPFHPRWCCEPPGAGHGDWIMFLVQFQQSWIARTPAFHPGCLDLFSPFPADKCLLVTLFFFSRGGSRIASSTARWCPHPLFVFQIMNCKSSKGRGKHKSPAHPELFS